MTEQGITPHDSLAVDRTVGEILATWMRRQRITQKEMALHLGFTQSTMSRKLLGQTPWYLAELVAACDVLGSSLPDLYRALRR